MQVITLKDRATACASATVDVLVFFFFVIVHAVRKSEVQNTTDPATCVHFNLKVV